MRKTLIYRHFLVTASLLLLLLCPSLSAQDEVWSGLKEPQKVLPKGNAPFQTAARVPFRHPQTILVPVKQGEWIIRDGWTLHSGESFKGWSGEMFNATVPGTVLSTLINQGVYPDPYYGLNNMSIPDSLSKMDWWYETDFQVPKESDRLHLLFNGINYRSEIFLNGTKIGETKGAFERGLFDISHLAPKRDSLHLQVHVFPLEHPGIPHEQSIAEGQGLNGGATSLDGPTFIASVGWDWMPGIRDRNMGLWQDVRLISTGTVRISDPLIMTDLPLPDTTRADIHIEMLLENEAAYAANGKLRAIIRPIGKYASDEATEVALEYSIAPKGAKKIILSPKSFPQLRLQNPKLWWPNGYGEASLYELELVAEDSQQMFSDSRKVRFGIRELSYELMALRRKGNLRIEYNPNDRFAAKAASKKLVPVFDNEARVLVSKEKNLYIPSLAVRDRAGITTLSKSDPIGPNLVIKVNGVRIFCRGGDWGMDDALKRSSRERLEPYFKLHKEINFNIIRNWTGETTQESFYELCDEYGMLVWNDFWMTGDDTVGPLDFELFLRNATDVVRRFRCHPSIAVWGPRNEGFAPKGLEKMLSEMVAVEDPTRHYHGQSRFLNMGTSGPWNYFEDPSYYFRERADGFNTEMGSFSIPTASTIRKFIAPQDRWPINDVWAYHDLHHTSQNFKGFMRAVEAAGGLSTKSDSLSPAEADSLMAVFSDAAQGVCYDAWRAMLESWNSRMWDNTTGLILWMSHPAWPSFIWQTYSYDGGTPGAYFGAKKACEPIHIQLNPGKENTSPDEVSVVNVSLINTGSLTASASYYDIKGRLLYQNEGNVSAQANSQTICFILTPPTPLPESYMIRLELRDNQGVLISINDYWKGEPYSEKRYLRYPSGSDDVEESLPFGLLFTYGDSYIEVQNFSDYIFKNVALSSDGILSDNYFNLLPGETKHVTVL